MFTERNSYRSTNLEEHMAFMKERGVLLRPLGMQAHKGFQTTFAARFLDDCYAARSFYGPAMTVSKQDARWAQNHFLSMPVSGRIHCTLADEIAAADSGRFLLYPPNRSQHFETDTNTDEIFLAIRPDYLRRFCARFLGRPVSDEIRFAPTMAADAPHARALRMAADLCLSETPRFDGQRGQHGFETAFREFVAHILLFNQPHDLSAELLNGPVPLPAPRDVKRAIDYIHANLSQTIRLEDLIREANVPGRTLNEHFRRFMGLSPMAFLKRERLRLARRLLISEPDRSVTDIATECGFFHLGRFSADYADAFGERPSDTRTGGFKRRSC